MRLSQVAAQLYTVRDHLTTPAEIAQSLHKIRAIGYEAVQASGLGPIENAALLKIAAQEGLTICATHEKGSTILRETNRAIANLQELNCKYTAYPYPNEHSFDDLAQVKNLAAQLHAAGAKFRAAGKVLAYHNHALEFVRHGSQTALEIIYNETSAETLQAELDTYWIQFGGGDPVEWCQRMAGRLPLLHMKDYAFTSANEPAFAEIGSGNLNWPAIIHAAEESGCEWFIVEQDVCAGDPFESLSASFNFIREHLVP